MSEPLRRRRTSLRWRLTAWVAAVMLASTAVTFVVIYRDTGRQLRAQIARDIGGDATQLSQSLRLLAGDVPAQIAAVAGGYVRAQPYNASSTLLFAIVAGQREVSNHPELFGAASPDNGETVVEQARENSLARELLRARSGLSTLRGPDVGPLRLFVQRSVVGRVHVLVGAGEPLALVARAQSGVAHTFVLAGALTIALALLASYFAGARVASPLRRMATIAARVDGGDLEPRMAVPARPADEVRVLAESFNHMLDRLADAFAGQRDFIADASHELRTPLTVIRGQLEVLAEQEKPSAQEVRRVGGLVQDEIARMTRLVDDLLLLAQSAQTDFLRLEEVVLERFVTELWDGISLTAQRRFELGPVPRGSLLADPDRLAQALRNVARNAIEHTRRGDGLVRLEAELVSAARIRFAVEDNGPGVPLAERERVFERLHRSDPARSRSSGGAGLGLAIVRAIATAHGGNVTVTAPRSGKGARFELTLPGFTADVPEPQRNWSSRSGVRPDVGPSALERGLL